MIRKATANDAAQLSLLAEATFRETFGAHNTPENMALHCQLSYGEAIQAREIAAPDMTTLLSVNDKTLTGFAQLRWGTCPRSILAAAPGEIQRLYVTREWQGRGVAHELMNACIAEFRNRGCDVIWLGVWERNPRAISFYRKFGFVEAGEHVFSLGRDPQRDLLMARPVDGSG